jgi:hypothetical protein
MTYDLVKFCAEKGVPLPETCEKLNWQGETNFIWVNDGSEYKLHSKSDYLIEYLFNEANQQRLNFDKWREIEENCKAVNGRLAQGKLSMATEILTILGKDTSGIYVQDFCEIDGIPAPQMHEIAINIPYDIDVSDNKKKFFRENYILTLRLVPYIDAISYEAISISCKFFHFMDVEVKNHHYAQAYAELYIKLREKGLIS